MSSLTEDFWPTANWARLRLRAQLLDRLRQFFKQRGFLEVETPLLSSDTVVDRHIEPLPVTLLDGPRTGGPTTTCGRLWLQTSPEFGMKRLLAAGGEAIFQVTKSFRGGESGAWHNLEFTLVEWYRVRDSLAEGMQLLDELAQVLLGRGPAERLTYQDAFLRQVGVDPHSADVSSLRHALVARCGQTSDWASFDRDALLDLLLVECVEIHLGRTRPTIVYDYPASQAALAVVRHEEPPVAERFELYVDGVELANGYHELRDAEELRRRMARANDQRAAEGKARLPEVNRLLAAMKHGLPRCTGVALGFDRLVAIAAGVRSIREVMAFPFERA
jgi:lysyl-tRNA synthetase class 2